MGHYRALQEKFSNGRRFKEVIRNYQMAVEEYHNQIRENPEYHETSVQLNAEIDNLNWFDQHYEAELVNTAEQKTTPEIPIRSALQSTNKQLRTSGFYGLLEKMGRPTSLPERTGQ